MSRFPRARFPALFLGLFVATALAQDPVERLWGSRIAPGSTAATMTDTANATNPYLVIHAVSADSANGAAVVICPGGGYDHLSGIKEGRNVARVFNGKGISAFVLHYRVGTTAGTGYHHPMQMWDAQRALRWVRANAKRFRIDTARVGIVGFSAGGHLASTAATHWDKGNPDSTSPHYFTGAHDSVDGYSSRPSFQVLVYPVINMDSTFTHAGSKKALLGNTPSATLLTYLSNEKQVRANTPPAFIVHTTSDATVPIKNSQVYADSLQKYGVRRLFKVFPTGTHGFGLADGQDGAPTYTDVRTWPTIAFSWLDSMGMLQPVAIRPTAPGPRASPRAGNVSALRLNGGAILVEQGNVAARSQNVRPARDMRGRAQSSLKPSPEASPAESSVQNSKPAASSGEKP